MLYKIKYKQNKYVLKFLVHVSLNVLILKKGSYRKKECNKFWLHQLRNC